MATRQAPITLEWTNTSRESKTRYYTSYKGSKSESCVRRNNPRLIPICDSPEYHPHRTHPPPRAASPPPPHDSHAANRCLWYPLPTFAARERLFLARQPDYKPSVPPTPGQGEGSPFAFFRRRLPRKCWARELAVRESWHSLLAERDVTVGNSEYSEWEGGRAASKRAFGCHPNVPNLLYVCAREGLSPAIARSAFPRFFSRAIRTRAEVLWLPMSSNCFESRACACCYALPDLPRPLA